MMSVSNIHFIESTLKKEKLIDDDKHNQQEEAQECHSFTLLDSAAVQNPLNGQSSSVNKPASFGQKESPRSRGEDMTRQIAEVTVPSFLQFSSSRIPSQIENPTMMETD
jgi:hypothetical protein